MSDDGPDAGAIRETPWLDTQLSQARAAFTESSIALEAFVSASHSSLEKDEKQRENLRQKFIDAREGRLPPPEDPPPEGTVNVELSEDDVELIVDAMEHFEGLAARFPTMLYEMAVIYVVALLDAYLGDVFRAVLISRPEMLRSRRQLTYEAILSYEDREQLVAAMASRDISEISYKSLRDQLDYYGERFGIDLSAADTDANVLVEVAARRNLYVHNAGIVNATYRQLVPWADVSDGDRLPSDASYWTGIRDAIVATVDSIDNQLRRKFLPAQPPDGDVVSGSS